MKTEKISGTQVATVLFLMIVATAILYLPGIATQKAKQSAWLSPICSSLAGFVSLWLVTKIGQRFPQSTLPQCSDIILGKIGGKVFAGSYVLFFLMVNILIIRQFTEFLTMNVLIGTPMIWNIYCRWLGRGFNLFCRVRYRLHPGLVRL